MTALPQSSSSVLSSQSTRPSHLDSQSCFKSICLTTDQVHYVYIVHCVCCNENIIAPALHRNTVSVNTGELVLAAAGQGEQDLVRGVGGARARVVVNLNGKVKEEEESNRPLGGAQQPRGLAGPVGRHHVRVSDVGGDPEVGARVVDYARQTEANVFDPALVVVDRSEQVLES